MLLYQLIQLLLNDPVQFLLAIVVLIFPLLISITVHEWAHGFVAYKFGDITPQVQGRLSFNPFSHLDPVGTLMLFIVGIGWAKPVQINPSNIGSKPKLLLVAFAGPFSNFVLAVLFILIFYLMLISFGTQPFTNGNGIFALTMLLLGFIIRINFALGLFNLLPIPPLDGSNIVANMLPDKLANAYMSLSPFGFPVLLLLLISGGLRYIFNFAMELQKTILVFIDSILFNVL